MGWDTATITAFINADQYNQIAAVAQYRRETAEEDAHYFLQTPELYDHGIRWIRARHETGAHYNSYSVMAFINFARMLQDVNRVIVVQEEDNELVEAAFNRLIAEHLPYLPYFHEWKCHRIDYTCSIPVPWSYAESYVYLMNHGRTKPNRVGRDRIGGSYWKRNKAERPSRKINFYDKASKTMDTIEQERADEQEPPADKIGRTLTAPERGDYLRDSMGVVRLEVQLLQPGIYYFKKREGLDYNSILQFMRDKCAYNAIEPELKYLVGGPQPYRTEDATNRLIDQLDLKPGMKLKYKRLIKKINYKKSSITSAQHSLVNSKHEMTLATFNRHRKALLEAGINPVCITDNLPLQENQLVKVIHSGDRKYLRPITTDALPTELESLYSLFLKQVQAEHWNL